LRRWLGNSAEQRARRPTTTGSPTNYWGRWLEELLDTFGSYLLNVLPKAVEGLLTYRLPLAFVAYFPQAFSHVPLIDTALRLTASGAYGGGECRPAA
jgi:hypothetical protein